MGRGEGRDFIRIFVQVNDSRPQVFFLSLLELGHFSFIGLPRSAAPRDLIDSAFDPIWSESWIPSSVLQYYKFTCLADCGGRF